jgi:hypothetical protein
MKTFHGGAGEMSMFTLLWELNIRHFIRKEINYLIVMVDELIDSCYSITVFVYEITSTIP